MRRAHAIPAVLITGTWLVWLLAMIAGDRWELVGRGWPMSLTMAFGSFVAGATSEGGGAVAFPVMTLALGFEPSAARDFSLMIQSVGMTSAAAAILLTGIRVELRAIAWATLGGALGLVAGLEWVADLLPAAYTKMFFTAVWLSFAGALFMINRYREREVHTEIVGFLPRHAVLLVASGVAGGLVSSITGSGLDITIFSLLVLRLRINEKIATPTSVVLMAGNALVGFLWKGGVRHALAPEAWDAWWACVPIVVVGAPIGAWFIERRSRHFVSRLLYAAIGIQSVAALVLVPLTASLLLFSAAVLLAGTWFFRFLAARGVRRLEWLGAGGASGPGGDGNGPRAVGLRQVFERGEEPETHTFTIMNVIRGLISLLIVVLIVLSAYGIAWWGHPPDKLAGSADGGRLILWILIAASVAGLWRLWKGAKPSTHQG